MWDTAINNEAYQLIKNMKLNGSAALDYEKKEPTTSNPDIIQY